MHVSYRAKYSHEKVHHHRHHKALDSELVLAVLGRHACIYTCRYGHWKMVGLLESTPTKLSLARKPMRHGQSRDVTQLGINTVVTQLVQLCLPV